MDPFEPPALVTATLVSSFLAYRSFTKKTLTMAGAVTGCLVGFCMVGTGLRGLTLFFFYQLGSWATKYKSSFKATLDETVSTSSVRGPGQVLAVSCTAVLLSLYHAYCFGPEQPFQATTMTTTTTTTGTTATSSILTTTPTTIAAALLAGHAVCLGDTLASEVGMASFFSTRTSSSSSSSNNNNDWVRLVLPPFPKVPPGTNGGVTWNGTLWSIGGGILCGIFTLLMDAISGILQPPPSSSSLLSTSDDMSLVEYMGRILLFAGISGGVGSLLDSILGATVQMTYWDPETKQICHHHHTTTTTAAATAKGPTQQQPQQGRRKHIAGIVPLLSNEGVNFVSVLLTTILGGWILAPLILP